MCRGCPWWWLRSERLDFPKVHSDADTHPDADTHRDAINKPSVLCVAVYITVRVPITHAVTDGFLDNWPGVTTGWDTGAGWCPLP